MRDPYGRDMSFSTIGLSRERVTIPGFMAPPFKAEPAFFVLTKMPMSVCPFCEPGQAWPDDVIAARPAAQPM